MRGGYVLQRGVVCGMFLWEGEFLWGRGVSFGSRFDLDARGLSLQEVRTCGREHALVKEWKLWKDACPLCRRS